MSEIEKRVEGLGTNGYLVDPEPSKQTEHKAPAHPNEGQTLTPQGIAGEAPKNLQGKDAEGVIEDYKKLQSELGRRANEIGELRQQIAQLQAQSAEATDYAEPDDEFEAKLRPLQNELRDLKAKELRAELRSTHPEYESIVQDDGFREWVKERESRMLLAMSGESGNVNAARELLDMYAEARESGNATPREAIRRDRVARASASERGTGQTPTGQIYRRAELQNMRAYNPQRYQELLPDIKRAYAEGRVR